MMMMEHNITLYKSMFLLAFHAFLRVGEITHDVRSQVNVIQVPGDYPLIG
jgi:hypothetical protein